LTARLWQLHNEWTAVSLAHVLLPGCHADPDTLRVLDEAAGSVGDPRPARVLADYRFDVEHRLGLRARDLGTAPRDRRQP
jgi:hypothetical protein